MLLIKLFALAYLLAAILAAVMAVVAIKIPALKVIFSLLGLAMPALALYALVVALSSPKAVPCFQEQIAGVEDDIESERLAIFGGDRTSPSFGKRWEKMYEQHLERLALKAGRVSEKVVAFAGHFRPTHMAS